jgi:hypothetical protein
VKDTYPTQAQAGVPNLDQVTAAYEWRPVPEKAQMHYVRLSDGFVADRRKMSVVEMARYGVKPALPVVPAPKAEAQSTTEVGDVAKAERVRAEDTVGQKYGHLTVRELVDRYESGAAVGLVKCDCGAEKRMLVSDVQKGKRTVCDKRKCPLVVGETEPGEANAGPPPLAKKRGRKATEKVARRAKRMTRRKPDIEVRVTRRKDTAAEPAAPVVGRDKRELEPAVVAASLRHLAVLATRGMSVAEIVGALRARADQLDELVY